VIVHKQRFHGGDYRGAAGAGPDRVRPDTATIAPC
jgi:hypothetical protein